MNKSHVIERTKACTVAFMKAINSLVIRCREERINWRKKQKMVKIYFQASANRFWLTWKSCSWFSKADNGQSSAKWTSWKGNDMSLKVDDIYSLLRKSHWNNHWSTNGRRRTSSKLLMVFTFNFSFICYLDRIYR